MESSPVLSAFNRDEGKQWPQFLAAATATIGVFVTGFHTGWPAPSLPKLLSDEYPYEVSNSEASYIVVIAYLGNLFGGLSGPMILDKIGRRKTILLIALPLTISFSLIALSYTMMELLYLARFIGGLAEGMTFTIIPFYIAETAEPKIRGTLGTLMSVTCIMGILFVNIVGSYLTIKLSATIFLAFPVLFLVLFWKMPESPYYLLMKNREDDAEKVLKFLRRKANVSDELSILIKDVNRQMSETGTFRDIFLIDSNRRALFLIVGLRIVQQLTGIIPIGLYIQILLKEATQALPPHIAASIFLLVQASMAVLSTVFVDRCGRRPLLLFSTAGCCINLLLQATYFTIKEHTFIDVSVMDWFPLVMLIVFVILFSSGLGVVVNILSSEVFSASIKGKAVCLVNVVFGLTILSTTKFYQITADGYGLSVPFWSFGFGTFLGTLFIYYFIPETKGKSLEEIQQQLKGHGGVPDKL